MSNSSIRDPLDRLVTRREAHAISAHTSVETLNQAMETGLLQAMIRKALAEMQEQNERAFDAAIEATPRQVSALADEALSEQAERVRGGG